MQYSSQITNEGIKMIEKLFTTDRFKPVILKRCTLYLNIKPIPLGTVYIMHSFQLQECSQVGSGWKIYKKLPPNNKGYFSIKDDFDYVRRNIENYSSEEIAIMGYDKNIRYHLLEISIGNYKNVIGHEPCFTANFHFNNFNKTLIK
jgi:hypothetical protein